VIPDGIFQGLVAAAEVGIAISDARLPDCPLVYVNPAFLRITGYSAAEALGRNCRFLQGSEKSQSAIADIRTAIAAARSVRVLLRNQKKDGSIFWNSLLITPVRDQGGSVSHFFSVFSDVSAEVRSQSELEQINRHWSALLDNSPALTMLLDTDGNIRYESASIAHLLGAQAGAAIGRPVYDRISEADHSPFRDAIRALALEGQHRASLEFRATHADGSTAIFDATVTNCLAVDAVQGIVVSANDVTARRRAEAQLLYDATHDALTGLMSRAEAMRRLSAWMKHYENGDTALTIVVMLLDLDQFKALNDTRGHAVGDQFLVQIAHRLTRECTFDGTIARFGGDEFLLIARFEGDASQRASALAGAVLKLVQRPVYVENTWVVLSGSIGIAAVPEAGKSADVLLRNVDIALYQAKDAGRNGYRWFEDSAVSGSAHDRLSLRAHLITAFERGEFRLAYQPIVDAKTGTACVYEVLLRWQHPTRGLLNAAVFIDEIEAVGLDEPLTRWVIAQALKESGIANAAAQNGITPPLRLAINIWPRSLRTTGFAEGLAQLLREHGARPEHLEFELTEGDFVREAGTTPDTIRALIDHGIEFVIDDFGKGFSNFGYLTRFPIRSIKIDREFVAAIGVDPRTETLIRAMIRLAHELSIQAVGEGVETSAQRDFLLALGCTLQQGFLFGHATPASVTFSSLPLR
jgi:diguanylate cyclase